MSRDNYYGGPDDTVLCDRELLALLKDGEVDAHRDGDGLPVDVLAIAVSDQTAYIEGREAVPEMGVEAGEGTWVDLTDLTLIEGHYPEELIPKAPTRGSLAGYHHDGEAYCIDCFEQEMDMDAEKYRERPREVPYGGAVYTDSEVDAPGHACGRHSDCVNAVPGDETPYFHAETVAPTLDETFIYYTDG